MRKLFGVALLLLASAAVAADRPATPEIMPPSNGEDWMRLSSTEKLFWSIGYSTGYMDALNKIDVASGPNSPCAQLAARTELEPADLSRGCGLTLGSRRELREPSVRPQPRERSAGSSSSP